MANISGIIIHGDGVFHGNVNNFVITPAPPVPHDPPKTFLHDLPSATPHFKGRVTTLNGIHEHFVRSTSPKNCCKRTVAIVGFGGTGKSETACQFASVHRDIYPNVAWINAESEQSALASFCELAKKFNIASSDNLAGKVYEYIDAHYTENVLFIFDNAMQLQSDENGFGIIDYLPVDALANQRFPFVIITTQTPEWHKGMTTFQLEDLSEDESLEFFHSSLNLRDLNLKSKCDGVFKQLHTLLQGYPLAMNLATSSIDFVPGQDTAEHLQEQIDLYIQKFQTEDSEVLTENLNKNCLSKYNQTLSTVWQLSLKRLEAEAHGQNALMLLRASSFYLGTVTTKELLVVHTECPHCPNTPDWMKFDQLKKSIRLLQKYYAADCLYGKINHSEDFKALQSNSAMDLEDLTSRFQDQVKRSESFWFRLRVHRLVKLVVRLQMDCSTVIEDILRSQVFYRLQLPVGNLNICAVEEALKRAELTTMSLTFVGLRALQGDSTARTIVESRKLKELVYPAATTWRLYYLDKDMDVINKKKILMLRRLIKLVSGLNLRDRRCVTQFLLLTFDNMSEHDNFEFQKVQDLALELFAIGRSFTDECSIPLLCENSQRRLTASCTEELGKIMIKGLTKAQMPEASIAEIRALLSAFHEERRHRDPRVMDFHQYEEDVSEVLDMASSLLSIIEKAELRVLDQAQLTKLFGELFNEVWSASAGKNMNVSLRALYTFKRLDVLVRAYVQCRRDTPKILSAIMSAFGATVARTEVELSAYLKAPPDYWIEVAIEACSTWMFISIQDGVCSGSLAKYISSFKILAEIQKTPLAFFNSLRAVVKPKSSWEELRDNHAATYTNFIEKYSNSTEEAFKTLVVFGKEIQLAMSLALHSIDSDTAGTSNSERS